MTETAAVTLYSAEQELIAYLDTQEGGIPPEQEREFAAALQESLKRTVDKRDAVAQFRAHVLDQAAFAKSEAKRLKERAGRFEAAADKLDQYIESTILSLPRDAKGHTAKLEGRTSTLQLRSCPDSVLILIEENIPSIYKHVTVKMPAHVWESLCIFAMRHDGKAAEKLLEQVTRGDLAVDKVSLKKALQANLDVPGADLATNKYKVEVK